MTAFRNAGDVVAESLDRWSWWRAALADPTEIGKSLLVHESEPHQGYFRVRRKDGQWESVAIFFPEGSDELVAYRDGNEVRDINSLWTWCCRFPISFEAYEQAMAGGGFDDEPDRAPGIGDNIKEADPLDVLRIEYLGEKEMAEAFLKQPIKTKADADKASIWAKRLSDIANKATALHKVEKQPSLDEGRRVDEKWRELKEEPKAISVKLKRHQDDWFNEQDRIERARQREAREEADRLRREAEDAARSAAHADVAEDDGMAEARQAEVDRLAQQAAAAEREAEARRVSAGRTGATTSLRTFTSAQITDPDALLMALKDRPEIKEIMQSLANRAAKAGVALPGMKIVEERRVV